MPATRTGTDVVVPTSAADVHVIVDLLHGVDADPRVIGGWGIDAIVGRQTREHRDLDLAIRAEALELAVRALVVQGFVITTDWLPVRIELSRADRHVDVHPLHFRPDGSAWQAGQFDSFEYPVNDWVTGRIGGRTLVCLTPSRQRLFHSGYEHSDKDRHDMALLDSAEHAR